MNNINYNDEIVSIEYIGEDETIDINIDGDRLFYCNDILTHNSAIDEAEHSQAMIGGGISKIQKADNVISIYASSAMKERGEFQCQFLKTRSSSGVGQKVFVGFDPISLRIFDLDEDYVSENSIQSGTEVRTAVTNVANASVMDKIKQPPTNAEQSSTAPKAIGESNAENVMDRLKRLQNKGKI